MSSVSTKQGLECEAAILMTVLSVGINFESVRMKSQSVLRSNEMTAIELCVTLVLLYCIKVVLTFESVNEIVKAW